MRNESGDEGLEENLYIVTTLLGERKLSRDNIALVFDAPGPRASADTMLTQFDPSDSTLTVGEPFLVAGGRVMVLTSQGCAPELPSTRRIRPHSVRALCASCHVMRFRNHRLRSWHV